MKIVIVTQYFWPENFRINDLAQGLRERGHEVTVFTGKPNYPDGRFFPGYGFFTKPEEVHQGMRVIRVPLIPRGSGGGIRLAINYLSFALLASIVAPFRCRGSYDVILVYEVSPITVALPALVLKLLKKTPVMLWVLDLWPESLSATRAVRNGLLIGAVSLLVKFIYRCSDKILVQSRAFEDRVAQMGGAPEKIAYFPNWAEPLFDSALHSNTSSSIPLPAGFRIMYAGNIGAAQDFPSILAAAEQLRSRPEIQWIVLGDGRLREWVEQEIRKRDLNGTVHLLGSYPLDSMPAFFRQADVMLVSLKRDPIFELTIPGRLQSYLACGRPVIGMLDGEGARIIRESGAGLACGAEEPSALVALVLDLFAMSKAAREQMGTRGRAYYEIHFTRDRLLTSLEQMMLSLCESRTPR